MKEETLQKIRNVYQREFHDLPLAKDLPRLAKFVSICDEDGVRLSYVESKRLDIERYTKEKGTEFRIFYQVRRVLLTLCLALEGQAKCLEADRALLKLLDQKDCLIPPVMNAFLVKHFGGDTGKVVRVLKCVNQASIAPSLIELKTNMGMENTTKDVAGTWRIFIVLTVDSLKVTHIKQEICIKKQFLLEWKLTFTLSYNQMDQLRDINFNVIDLSFNTKTTSKKIAEVKGTVKSYLHPKITSEILNGKPQMMLESIPDSPRETKTQRAAIWPGEVQSEECNFTIPLASIAKCTRKKDTFELSCKDFRTTHFIFLTKEDAKQFLEIYHCLLPTHVHHTFAHMYCKGLIRNLGPVQSSSYALLKNGWRSFNMEEEFTRMKMSSEWRISDLNMRYQLSESYPGLLAVPRSVSDAELLMSCRYRVGGRVPVLSWIHKNQSILCHGATALSSDIASSVSREDEKVLAAIIRTTEAQPKAPPSPRSIRREHSTFESARSKSSRKEKFNVMLKLKKSSSLHARRFSNPSSPPDDLISSCSFTTSSFYIVDLLYHGQPPIARDYTDGFPGLSSTTTTSIGTSCLYVDSLSELKESYAKLQRICTAWYQEEDHWLSHIDNSRWLVQIKHIMEGARRMVEIMDGGSSIFLSCPGDGWDRGCQLSALAQLWMDPFYRTIDGFAVLIEKEWLSFGHPFLERSNILVRDTEAIPVFIQWLDVVWQTLQQFPNFFEFNSSLLVEIAESTYSGVYGTFLFNHEKSRRESLARMNTESFWTHISGNFRYQNPFYVHSHRTLFPSCTVRVLSVWTGFYLRCFEPKDPRMKGASGSVLDQSELVKEQLGDHISALELALVGIKKQLLVKTSIHQLMESGVALDEAVVQVTQSAEKKGEIIVLNSPSPVAPRELRRSSKFGTIICSHRASLERSAPTIPVVRVTVDDSAIPSQEWKKTRVRVTKRNRKAISEKISRSDVDTLLQVKK